MMPRTSNTRDGNTTPWQGLKPENNSLELPDERKASNLSESKHAKGRYESNLWREMKDFLPSSDF